MLNNKSAFDLLFNPKTVVILEAKEKISFFIQGFKRQGFNLDNLYLISSSEDKIHDIKCYKSINDIPIDSVDLLILSVNRDLLIDTLNKFLEKKNVNFIHIFTAGTAEFDEKGIQIERKIRLILDKYPKTRAIGPNCMGLYNPNGKIAYYPSFPVEPGNIGLVFQSGDLHSKMIKFSTTRYNLRFSKGVSIGNCVDIQFSEILEYYNEDDEIDLICVYFEGFSILHQKEGKKLFQVLKSMKKPVLFMRGGKTKRGQSAILTHTGSLATSKNIWDAIYKQTPLIEVQSSIDELIDYTYCFSSYLSRFRNLKKKIIYPKGKRALVILWSGGFGILATDMLNELGLEMPVFEGEALEKLKHIYPIKIGSLSNPFDLPWIIHRKEFVELSKAAIGDNIDIVIVETDAWSDMESERFKSYYNNLYKLKEYVESIDKIFVIILHQYPSKSREILHNMFIRDNFLVYSSIEIAAKAFFKLYEFGKKLHKI
ncbi:MAG: hypothetical protein ACFE8M_07510 [Candidatus Hermodarchaeota archaeon]